MGDLNCFAIQTGGIGSIPWIEGAAPRTPGTYLVVLTNGRKQTYAQVNYGAWAFRDLEGTSADIADEDGIVHGYGWHTRTFCNNDVWITPIEPRFSDFLVERFRPLPLL